MKDMKNKDKKKASNKKPKKAAYKKGGMVEKMKCGGKVKK